MYYTYVLIIPTIVCLLFSTAIPTSLFNFKQLFFILVTITIIAELEFGLVDGMFRQKGSVKCYNVHDQV